MSLTEADVRQALAHVDDPLIEAPITELGMVRSVEVKKGAVRLEVAIAVDGRENTGVNELEQRIHHALAGVPDVKRIEARFVPMTDEERTAAASHVKQEGNPFTDARTRVLAISSGKGGVGKSSVTVNLAVSLARQGHSVAVVDADVWGFSVPRMLGVDQPPALLDHLIVPPRAYGVKVISMGFFTDEDQPVIWRGPMLHKALEQFLTDVHWGQVDYLIVDMPPGTGDIALSMAQFLPRAEVVVVTTPQEAAQTVAQRAAFMADKVRLTVTGVVENMSWFRADDGKAYEIFGNGGGQTLADRLNVPLLGQIPLVPALREGGDEGRPIVVTDPDSEAAQAFTAIAATLHELGPRRIAHPELKIV